MKDTKHIRNLREAIKEQDLNPEYYVRVANAIKEELESEYIDRNYISEKIDILLQLKNY